MLTPVQLLVGIGNPGPKFAQTRHNAGERWVRQLAESFDISLLLKTRHRGYLGHGDILGHEVRLLVPLTYVNASGESINSVCKYFDITPNAVLIAYDEVAFPVGKCRLKFGGGANGHNGIRSVISHFGGCRDFGRLRIGVDHPGNPEKLVPYLTRTSMPQQEMTLAEESSALDDSCLDWLLSGDWQRAMTQFHTDKDEVSADHKADSTQLDSSTEP